MKFHALSAKLTVLFMLAFLIAAGAGLLLSGCGRAQVPAANADAAKTLYTCGMHPQVVQPTPGNCPICGMNLTPIRKQTEAAKGSSATPSGERKIKYYKSTMILGEVRPTPGQATKGKGKAPRHG